jgi:TnpA family transposase
MLRTHSAVFFHERGEIRDRSFDSQAFRASGLNLVSPLR